MDIKVLASGSNGNCAIITDSDGCQLVLDCGIKYDKLSIELDWSKPIAISISHKHLDHYNPKTIEKLKLIGVPILDDSCFVNNQLLDSQNWKILPISLPHAKDTNSWSFIIYNIRDKKLIFFATDCKSLPRIADRTMDLIMVENNYSEKTVFDKMCASELKNSGYARHLSMEYVVGWISERKHKCKNLLITHLSNSGNINTEILKDIYKPYADNVYVATKKISFDF